MCCSNCNQLLMEKLNDDEVGIYKMLDTLKTVRKFKQLYNKSYVVYKSYYIFYD